MMYEIPIFPLNAVLFPGTPIKLHIFEDRYKLMIEECYQEGQPFGISLIRSGQEVGGQAEPFSIGCSAVITELEPLTEGRYNLVALGTDRFQIITLKNHKPYLTALVEPFALKNTHLETLQSQSDTLRIWIRKYLRILAEATETKLDQQQLPNDPSRLAYIASFLLNIPSAQKQSLLTIENLDELIAQLRIQYRREVTLLEAMLRPQPTEDPRPFSNN